LNRQNETWLFDLIILSVIIGIAYFATLGLPPLYIPDEGRYAEIPREMLLNHQYIIPYLDGVVYFEKPPLIYWLIAFFEHTFGFSEWSVRAVNALMGLFTCLSLYVFGRHYYDRTTGYFAALTLATSLLFFCVAHILTLDMGVTFFLTLSLLFLYAGLQSQKKYLLYLGYTAIALGILTKGLIGIIFPGMIFFLWLLITHQWRLLKHACIPGGLLLILIISLPWHILAQLEQPSFFHEYIINQQFLRFLTTAQHRQMSFGIYLLIFATGFLPWVIFTCLRLKKLLHTLKWRLEFQREWFFICWVMAIFIFFAPSNSVLITYFQPMMPGMALLTAPYLSQLWHASKNMKRLLIGLLLFTTILYNAAWLIAPNIANKSTKTLALTAAQLLKTHPDALLVSYNYYYQDVPYYTQHYVLIVNWLDELAPGYAIQPSAKNTLITDAAFWQLVQSKRAVYVITNQESYASIQGSHPKQLFLLKQNRRYVLLSNPKGMKP
jgi:4-amino-4-deoxy-L-arabinose transferase-like glycosyltransferase